MRSWLWHHRDWILFLGIEVNLLVALWPADQHITLVLLGRCALGTLAWWWSWRTIWHKAILKRPWRRLAPTME